MSLPIKTLESIKAYRLVNRLSLRIDWEFFLVNGWSGETYSDFVLMDWMNNRTRNSGARIRVANVIEIKRRAQIDNLRYREILKDKNIPEWRKPHYKALIWHKRCHINALNNMIFKILEGEI